MQCEGWRRNGGVLSFGQPVWEQCENDGIVEMIILQDNEMELLPACQHCWDESVKSDSIVILDVNELVED